MEILEIANKIKEKGGRLYLVGGAVRDELLGKQVHDEDYCVTGLSQMEFEELFPNAFKRGKFFGVYDIEHREFALARSETKTGPGHKEFEISTEKSITIEQDLARRDITINSMAKDVLTEEIIDPYNGKKDLQDKRIKATTLAFREDPLRVYRVARFAAQLEFTVEKNTLNLMNSLKDELNTLSGERVFEEFKKALATRKPSIFFETLKKAEVLDVHFKEIYDLIGSTQPEKYHPEGDSYNHTMEVVDNAAKLTNDLATRFSALVHDFGKGTTPKEMLPHHYGHDKRGVTLVENFGRRVVIPKTWQKCGKTSAKEHMLGGIFEQMTVQKQVDFITRVAKSRLGLEGMKIVVICDRTRNGQKAEEVKFDIIGKELLSTINGDYIKQKYEIKDERGIGELLRRERIEWLKKNIKKILK